MTSDRGSLAPPSPLNRSAALDTVAGAAELLFVHGQATEHTIAAAERLGDALGDF